MYTFYGIIYLSHTKIVRLSFLIEAGVYMELDLKNREVVVKNGGLFNVKMIEMFAIERYSETPRFVTFVHHVQMDDDTEFFCIRIFSKADPDTKKIVEVWERRNFIVPQQDLLMLSDLEYGQFVCTEVIDQRNGISRYWLIASCTARIGFIVSVDVFIPPT